MAACGEDQIQEFKELVLEIESEGLSRAELGRSIGYADGTTISHVLGDRTRPSVAKLEELRKLRVRMIPPAAPSSTSIIPIRREEKKEVSREKSVLAELNEIHDDVGRIIDKLHTLSERCVPLLRPGILQYAQTLDHGRKVLRIV